MKRGYQLIVDFLWRWVRMMELGNAEATRDGFVVVKLWLGETADSMGVIKLGWLEMLGSGDPWHDSRLAARAFADRWRGLGG